MLSALPPALHSCKSQRNVGTAALTQVLSAGAHREAGPYRWEWSKGCRLRATPLWEPLDLRARGEAYCNLVRVCCADFSDDVTAISVVFECSPPGRRCGARLTRE